jgi:hypothetical protein
MLNALWADALSRATPSFRSAHPPLLFPTSLHSPSFYLLTLYCNITRRQLSHSLLARRAIRAVVDRQTHPIRAVSLATRSARTGGVRIDRHGAASLVAVERARPCVVEKKRSEIIGGRIRKRESRFHIGGSLPKCSEKKNAGKPATRWTAQR